MLEIVGQVTYVQNSTTGRVGHFRIIDYAELSVESKRCQSSPRVEVSSTITVCRSETAKWAGSTLQS